MSPGRTLPVTEIGKHDRIDDVWIVVNGKVYDMTRFAPEHPGGSDGKPWAIMAVIGDVLALPSSAPSVIYAYAGRDATQAYNDIHDTSLIGRTLAPGEHMGDVDPASLPFPEPSGSSTHLAAGSTRSPTKPPLDILINLDDFEAAAQKTLSPKSWAFISGGSNANITRGANQDWFQKIWFRPRILRNVSWVSTKTSVLGCELSLPVWIAPTGLATMGGPEGEIALSRAAAEAGILQVISTNASFPLSDILDAAPSGYPFIFQLYVNKDRKKTVDLLALINKRPQIKAVFVTVDLPVVSKREADERLKTETVQASAISGSRAATGATGDHKGAGLARRMGSFIDPSFCWDDLRWLRRHTQLPLVLKGVQSAADARLALEMGCQGIVISNHGGRALDGAPAGVAVLLELHRACPEVFDHMDVLLHGGIRRGSDLVKAVCLGARAVSHGRPFLYALTYGKPSVDRLVHILRDEVVTAMQLSGVQTLDDADPAMINTAELDLLVPRGSRHDYARKRSSRQPSRM